MAPTLLLTGSAGGGKSRLAGEKVNGFCLKYPGAFGLVIRKVKASMTSGSVLFLEESIIGSSSAHYPSKSRFQYRNGSYLAYIGMENKKQRERVKSIGPAGGVDIVWIEEANELAEDDYNAVLGRMRGVAAPWCQIILTCNPDHPLHWIKRRLMDGKEAHVYYSHARDNPFNPPEYLDSLDMLTGIERSRLRDGLWVQASGVIYDQWREEENVTEEAVYIPGGGPVLWGVDDGYSAGTSPQTRGRDPHTGAFVADAHPRVILICQLKPDGHLDVLAEVAACLTLSDVQIAEALALPFPKPDFAAIGPGNAEIRGRLHAAGIYTRYAGTNVEESIKEMQRWIAADANGWRRVRVHPSCTQLRLEMLSYGRDANGHIIKAYDHSCFVAGTLVRTTRGDVPIEQIQQGDKVLTRFGYRPVVAAGMTDRHARVMSVHLSDGRIITGTGNHPFYVKGEGYILLRALRYGDILVSLSDHKEKTVCQVAKQWSVNRLSIGELLFGGIRNQKDGRIGCTSPQTESIVKMVWGGSIKRCGRMFMAPSRQGMRFTTETGIHLITRWIISNACLLRIIGHITRRIYQTKHGNDGARDLIQTGRGRQQRGGMGPPKAGHGIRLMENNHGKTGPLYRVFVSCAEKHTRHWLTTVGSVRMHASPPVAAAAGLTQNNASASTVEKCLKLTAVMPSHNAAPVLVVRLTDTGESAAVYNLTVECHQDAVGEYFANGILVHNCDACRYLTHALRSIA